MEIRNKINRLAQMAGFRRLHDPVERWATQAAPHIEAAAHRNRLALRVIGGVRAPQAYVFYCLVDPVMLHKALQLGEQLGLVLGVKDEPRVRREGGLVAIEVPVQPEHRYMVRAEKLPQSSRLRIPVGVSTANVPVFVNLGSPNYAHALVAGMTGSGKTELIRSMIYALANQNLDRQLALIVIDGKNGFRYMVLDRLAHLLNPVIVSTNEAIRACLWVVREIERRKDMTPADVREAARIVVIIDEVRHVLDEGGRDVAGAITTITESGREFGAHVILATHRPNKKTLGSVVTKANLGARFAFRVGTAEESAMVTGRPGAGAEKLIGSGDCLVGSQLLRIQAPMIEDQYLAKLPRNGDRSLNLDDFDCEDMISVRRPGATKKPFTAQEMAQALMHPEWGIRHMQVELSMGSDRATRLRTLVRDTNDLLKREGYALHGVRQTSPVEL